MNRQKQRISPAETNTSAEAFSLTEHLAQIARFIRSKLTIEEIPSVGVVLGSGLGAFTEQTEVDATLPFAEIPGFPVSTVSGHAGCFVFGKIEGIAVMLSSGRVHYYEGYEMDQAVLPIRVMAALGVKNLILTNAAGGIREDLNPGDFMWIDDHIASFVPSPLRGANPDSLGVRFPDMSEVYDRHIREQVLSQAADAGIVLKRGVYLQTSGPQYETPAEIRMFRTLGADAVGMSTACEAIAARHAGMRVAAVSCITNKAAGLGTGALSHSEVKETAAKNDQLFAALIKLMVREMARR